MKLLKIKNRKNSTDEALFIYIAINVQSIENIVSSFAWYVDILKKQSFLNSNTDLKNTKLITIRKI
ncbi:hypothetical protein T01_9154 [Trichinella spiralis]|uniref:Uncharacterized protein n=1 Tax=Trichinella spiralis TaxID=6334 RepID=A0A0V1BN41_TRISP|nr:hypothetical protein T01_9154 [Trichinella spiralis]